jgi:ketosteroid isomerase-like protein
MTIEDVVRACYASYPSRDRAMIEKIIADDFHFSSPLDNRIDRKTYFERCWLNGEAMAAIEIKLLTLNGERAFVTYEALTKDGRRFRNTEIMTVRDGRITDVEVYFGWSIPHEAKLGGFVQDEQRPGDTALAEALSEQDA